LRNEPNLRIECFRSPDPLGRAQEPGMNYGFFIISRLSGILRIISSGSNNGTSWEHVSVSLSNRSPTWDEMCYVKNLFWKEEENVIQFHPKRSKYKNQFPYVLHLWKKINEEHELPPDDFV
jgi:hypothetical protein